MTIDFYYSSFSAPCRAVLLTAKALGLDLNLKEVDLMKGEQLKPEYIKMNPQHCIPTINDNGFVLWESRAIITYLVSQYGKGSKLYPQDVKKRALVDQKLYFDIGTLYARFADYYYPVMFANGSYDPAKLQKLKDAVAFLNTFLMDQDYIVDDHLTVADLSLVATISSFEAVGFDLSSYENIVRWYDNVKKTAPKYEEANGKNNIIFKEMFEKMTKKN